jgi:hypothetical protein
MWALPELSPGAFDTLVGAVTGALIASLTALFVSRKTRLHQLRLERMRLEQDRLHGVFWDTVTLIDPVRQWLRDSMENVDRAADMTSPPSLDDSLLAKVKLGMQIDGQQNSRTWWWEWLGAYEEMVRVTENLVAGIAVENLRPFRARLALKNAEEELLRAFTIELGSLRSSADDNMIYMFGIGRRLYRHAVHFRGEPGFFEWLEERYHAFRQRFRDRAKKRRLARQQRSRP